MLCGLDEAGRGPLAGPVCAAAVVLPEDFPFDVLADSKKLSARAREQAMALIYSRALAWGLGWCSSDEIDRINILRASLLAMKRAYESLCFLFPQVRVEKAVADGLYAPDLSIPCEAQVKADSRIVEVMAASILAKTARDRMMDRYGWLYPEYGYEQHKGYPTKMHFDRIARFGPSPIQRKTFAQEKIQGRVPFKN